VTLQALRLSWSPGTLRVTLHRPERRNAINAALLGELHHALDQAQAAPGCRVVVLEGSGGVFCTGMDFAEAALPPGATRADAARGGEAFLGLLTRLAAVPLVVVSAVDGVVSGGGVGLAAASDFVYATGRSQFALPEALWGLLPCCVLPFLVRRAGFQKAYALALATTPVSAAQAEGFHLVDEVCDDPERPLRRLAARMARLDADTIGALKRYARGLGGITPAVERAALDEFAALLSSPAVQRRIGDFATRGAFPWEAAEETAPPAASAGAGLNGGRPEDRTAEAGGWDAKRANGGRSGAAGSVTGGSDGRGSDGGGSDGWGSDGGGSDGWGSGAGGSDAGGSVERGSDDREPDDRGSDDGGSDNRGPGAGGPDGGGLDGRGSAGGRVFIPSVAETAGPATPQASRNGGGNGASPSSPAIHRGTSAAPRPVAWLFPGQGSQRVGMGAELFGRDPELCALADRVLGYSVRELCLDDPGGRLGQTEYAQPALFVVNALAALARRDGGDEPAFLAGHSLGEFSALWAAGCFGFEAGLRLVRRRGQIMARAGGGGMTAVVGLPAARVEEIVAAGGGQVDVAGYNAPGQVALAGELQALQAVAETMRREGGRCVPLRVSAAFHSRWMEPAAAEFERVLAEVEFAAPRVPVLSNVTGAPHQPGLIASRLARQLREPVRWHDAMRYLLRHGVADVEEIGPGTVLTGLWRATRDAAPAGVPGPSAPPPPPAAPGAGAPVSAAALHLRRGTGAATHPAPRAASSRPASPASETDEAEGAGEARAGAITAETLGSAEFRRGYGLRYAYLAGSMFKGIASVQLVTRMAGAGLIGYFGAGGLRLERVEEALGEIRRALGPGGRFGMNLLHAVANPRLEAQTAELYLRHDVRFVEAAAYLQVTPPLVHFRFQGAHRDAQGRAAAPRSVLAKVSRPEIARAFLAPPPEPLLRRLVDEGKLTAAEAEAARELPLADAVCVEADSGGHTDGASALTLFPALLALRDQAVARGTCPRPVPVGAAGGIGAPEAAAAAFLLGADFVVTGSVNQCSPQAATSNAVKDILAALDVHDTAYAPAGDLFELGARVQVVRKGTLFPAQANRLYELYRRHASLDEIDPATRRALERTCFHRPLDEAWAETRAYLARENPAELERAERDPRQRMAHLFRWYFVHTARAARLGDPAAAARYQIHCGPAMGAFNRHVRGTALEPWRERHVDRIARTLMEGAAGFLRRRLAALERG